MDYTEYEDRAYDLHDYADVVKAYSLGKLSYESDMLFAFTGILNRSRTRTGIVFCSGLPLGRHLLPCMCWEILPSDRKGSSPKTRRPGFPSWCWTGWHGEPDWEDVMGHCKATYDRRTATPTPILDIQHDTVRKSARFIGVHGEILHFTTERATLQFQFCKDGDFFSKRELSYCSILHNGKTYRVGDFTTLLPLACFFLSKQDAEDIAGPVAPNKATYKAGFILLLSIRALADDLHSRPVVWALLIRPVNSNDVVVRRAAVVRIPEEIWAAAKPSQNQIILV